MGQGQERLHDKCSFVTCKSPFLQQIRQSSFREMGQGFFAEFNKKGEGHIFRYVGIRFHVQCIFFNWPSPFSAPTRENNLLTTRAVDPWDSPFGELQVVFLFGTETVEGQLKKLDYKCSLSNYNDANAIPFGYYPH